MLDYINGIGDYWIRLVEQMVPATTIWNTGVRLENSIFHRQKFVWRRQFGCKIVPIPCKPCSLVTQLFAYDCPTQFLRCGLYPWTYNPIGGRFGVLLTVALNSYLESQGLSNLDQCQLNTLYTQWYVISKLNGVTLSSDLFSETYGYQNYPTDSEWITGVETILTEIENDGYTYDINVNSEILTIYNVNCTPFDDEDIFTLELGINFTILCAEQ
jgi:hypothetical protein